jgi:hypothetical protein
MADIDIGAGITIGGGISFGGSGGGGGGGVTTYTEGVNYSTNGVEASDSTLKVNDFYWSSPAEVATIVAKPPGTTFSVVIGGSTLNGTLLGGFTEAAGLWTASVFIPGAAPGPASTCASITI